MQIKNFVGKYLSDFLRSEEMGRGDSVIQKCVCGVPLSGSLGTSSEVGGKGDVIILAVH